MATNTLVINVDIAETRVALIEEGKITELFLERVRRVRALDPGTRLTRIFAESSGNGRIAPRAFAQPCTILSS